MQEPNNHVMDEVAGEGGEAVAAPAEPPPAADSSDSTTALKEQIASLEDRLLRAKADLQNLQRRAAAERVEAVRFGNAELMKALLPVLDGLEESLKTAEGGADATSLTTGARLVHDLFVKTLRSFGLEAIEALRQPFDPTVHEALTRQPTTEHPPGTVVSEIARGYRLRDRVLRPARVVVSMRPEAPASSPEECQLSEAE
jgi:molecular chaperone GrpE